jgi:hypothetical protein
VYRITTDEISSDQVTALPKEALLIYAEILGVLELVPWQGDPMNDENPNGPLRTLAFGQFGMITYLILDDQLRVDLVDVTWV